MARSKSVGPRCQRVKAEWARKIWSTQFGIGDTGRRGFWLRQTASNASEYPIVGGQGKATHMDEIRVQALLLGAALAVALGVECGCGGRCL